MQVDPPRFVSPAEPGRPSTAVSMFAVLIGAWTLGITIGLTAIGQLVFQAESLAEGFTPGWFAPVSALFGAVLVVPPAAALIAVTRQRPEHPGALAAGWVWLIGGLAGAALGCVRATPLPQNEVLLGLSAVGAAVAGFVVRRLRSPLPPAPANDGDAQNDGAARDTRAGGYLVGLGLLMLAPWAAWAALGGVVETVLAGLLAIAVGYLVSGVLNDRFVAAFRRSRARLIVVGGLTAGVALAPIAAALGGPGVNVAELVTLPAVAFAAMAVAGYQRLHPRRSDQARPATPKRRRWRPTGFGALVALAVFGPVAFVDPEETSVVLGVGDVGTWATYATAVALLVALALGLAYGLGLRSRAARPMRWIPVGLALTGLLVAATAYVVAGRPGFYGERLFVVMAQQADLSGLSAIPDRDQRLRQTYDRLVQTAERTQAPLRSELNRLHIAYTPYYLVNAILVDAGPALRPFLSGRSDVDRVLLDQRLRPLPEPAPDVTGSDPAPAVNAAPQPNIQAINAPAVWASGDTGQGITIGTSDTGVDGGHPLLSQNFRGGDDSWYDPWNGSRQPIDHLGHGTHTIGTAVGRDGIGVAPGAQWIGCVNLDRAYGSPSRYLDCLQFMLAPFPLGGNPLRDGQPDRAPDILTNSWGCPPIEGCDVDALRPATAALAAAGIYMVVAAGNTGPGCATVTDPPAPYTDVMTVGATDQKGQLAAFSSLGPTPDGRGKPDLVAPGEDVLSALPHGTYGRFSGTSMATPHVAGVVALMWSANPKLIGNIAMTTQILRATARPIPVPAGDDCGNREDIEGAGMVDAAAAVQAARRAG